MSREIKFRVWDVIGKRMYSWPILIDNYIDDPNVILEQFTGIKDRNDKEIYEGDIISCLGRDFKEESRHEVKYGSGGFYLNNNEFLWYGTKNDIYKDGEIIGNIFENPELVKKYD